MTVGSQELGFFGCKRGVALSFCGSELISCACMGMSAGLIRHCASAGCAIDPPPTPRPVPPRTPTRARRRRLSPEVCMQAVLFASSHLEQASLRAWQLPTHGVSLATLASHSLLHLALSGSSCYHWPSMYRLPAHRPRDSPRARQHRHTHAAGSARCCLPRLLDGARCVWVHVICSGYCRQAGEITLRSRVGRWLRRKQSAV